MLILRRFPGEEVVIWQEGKPLKVRVVVKGQNPDGSIALGFEADSDVKIDRLEVFNRKKVSQLGQSQVRDGENFNR